MGTRRVACGLRLDSWPGSAEAASILIATDSYSPYWKARVDRAEVKLFPVDHAFQGVYVVGGQHEIVLEHAPPYAIRFGR